MKPEQSKPRISTLPSTAPAPACQSHASIMKNRNEGERRTGGLGTSARSLRAKINAIAGNLLRRRAVGQQLLGSRADLEQGSAEGSHAGWLVNLGAPAPPCRGQGTKIESLRRRRSERQR